MGTILALDKQVRATGVCRLMDRGRFPQHFPSGAFYTLVPKAEFCGAQLVAQCGDMLGQPRLLERGCEPCGQFKISHSHTEKSQKNQKKLILIGS